MRKISETVEFLVTDSQRGIAGWLDDDAGSTGKLAVAAILEHHIQRHVEAAEHRTHLTAFGVLLAVLLLGAVCFGLFLFLAQFGGR